MRQVVMAAPGVIEMRNVPDTTTKKGQVLMRIKRIGICGSDIHVYHGKHPFVKYPLVQGHEFFGIVEEVGKDVEGIRPGMKVTATPQEFCGVCQPCRRGQYNVCENLKVLGFLSPGVAQDLYSIDAEKVVVLPDSFTPEQGAFVEPVAVAVHASGRVGDLKDKNVVVLGAGPIGNLVAQACKCRGAKKVLITDLSDYRLEVARRVGINAASNARKESFSEAVLAAFRSEGFNVAFEAVGNADTLDNAIVNIGKGGTVVIVGVFGSRPAVDMARLGEHELTLIGSMMYRRDDYEKAIDWIANGGIQTAALESRHFPLEKYDDAYRYIQEKGEQSMKVFVDL